MSERRWVPDQIDAMAQALTEASEQEHPGIWWEGKAILDALPEGWTLVKPADPAPSTETLTLERLAALRLPLGIEQNLAIASESSTPWAVAYRDHVPRLLAALDAARQQGAAEAADRILDDPLIRERTLPEQRSALRRAALASPPDAEPPAVFRGQMDWPCLCGHPKADHYFGDALGDDGKAHTWCQREPRECRDFRPDAEPAEEGA